MEHRKTMVVALFVAVYLMCLIPSGESIKCFVCNTTSVGSICADPFDKIKAAEYIAECDGPRDILCRKIWQNIHGMELRIVRKCGQEKHENDKTCYSTTSETYKTTVCQCTTDDCNAALNLRSQYLMLPAAFIILFIYKTIL